MKPRFPAPQVFVQKPARVTRVPIGMDMTGTSLLLPLAEMSDHRTANNEYHEN